MIALALVAASGFAPCSTDKDQPEMGTKKAFISAATGSTAGAVNQELTLTVAYNVENKPGVFTKFSETASENTKVTEVETSLDGADCGTTAVTKTTTYKFKSSAARTYNLEFKKSAAEFITQTIVVSSAT